MTRLIHLLASLALVTALGARAEQYDSESYRGLLEVRSLVLGSGADLVEPEITLTALYARMNAERAKYPAQMTVEQLNLMADQLTLFVRSKGYLFHSVYLPPQKITNGVVHFAYQQAKLTDINVINHTPLESEQLSAPFKAFIGKPLYAKALNRRVNAFKSFPGLKVFAFYSRASQTNGIRLNLRVEPISAPALSLQVDNYGSQATGENRAMLEWQSNQPLGRFDHLSLALLSSLDGSGTLYGYINYNYMFNNLVDSLSLSAGNTQFELGREFAALDMTGDSTSLRLDYGHVFNPDYAHHLSSLLGIYQLQSTTQSGLDSTLDNDETSQAAQWQLAGRWGWTNGLINYSLAATGGKFASRRLLGEGEDTSFTKYNLALGLSQAFANNARWQNQWLLNLRSQMSPEPLPGIETVNFGGVYGVRSAEPSRFSGEQGWIANLDIRLPQLLPTAANNQWKLVPYVFVDAAQGKNWYSDPQYDTTHKLSGWGLGLGARWQALSARLICAQPINQSSSTSTATEEFRRETRWLFELRWH